MPKRRDGHEGWSRRYAEAYDRVFKPKPVDRMTPAEYVAELQRRMEQR